MSLEDKIEYATNLEAGQLSILQGKVIHIFDSEVLNPLAIQLCNLMEAQVTDSIIPFFTEIVIVDKVTPVLKQTISSLQSRAIEAERGSVQNVIGNRQSGIKALLSIKTVSIEWLKQCFLQEKILPLEQFKPEVSDVNGARHTQTQNSQRAKYQIRQNIFNGKTFGICKESFKTQGQN